MNDGEEWTQSKILLHPTMLVEYTLSHAQLDLSKQGVSDTSL